MPKPLHILPADGDSPLAKHLTPQDVWLTRREAADYLRRSVPTLERWAQQGYGPKYRRHGGPAAYSLADLREFAAGQPQQLQLPLDEPPQPARRRGRAPAAR